MSESDNARLQILLLDYQLARDDERQHIASLGNIVGIGVAAVAILAGFASNACQFADQPFGSDLQRLLGLDTSSCVDVPDGFLAGAPLVPFILFAFTVFAGCLSTIRVYYIRALEAELSSYGATLADWEETGVPSLQGLEATIASNRRGLVSLRVIYALMLAAIVGLFGGMTIGFASVLPLSYQVAMLLIYGSASAFVLFGVYNMSLGGRALMSRALAQYEGQPILPRRRTRAQGESEERTLASYLALPRPKELIKWVYFPVAFGLVATVARGDEFSLLAAVVLWLVLEYCVYSARYQWNDLRGFQADQAHFDKRRRGRLPGPLTAFPVHAAASGAVILVRLGLALVVAASIGGGAIGVVVIMIVAVWASAVIYEVVRSKTSSSEGFWGGIGGAAVVWTAVGLGAAIRAALGAYIATAGDQPAWELVTAVAVVAGLLAICLVTLTWALEGRAMAIQARGGDENGGSSLHIRRAERLLPARSVSGGADPMRPLRERGRLATPWNAAFVGSVVAGGWLGGLLIGGSAWEPGTTLGVLALSFAMGVGFCLSGGTPARLVTAAAGFVLLALLGVSLEGAGGSALVVGAPWLVAAALVTFYRAQSYDSIMSPLPLASICRSLRGPLVRAVLGDASARLLKDKEGGTGGAEGSSGSG